MVAIFTGLGAGFTRGSSNILGSAGQLGGALLGRGGESVSINAATGNLLLSRQDEFLTGLGLDVGIARTYNSLGQIGDQDNNDGWQQSTTQRLIDVPATPNVPGSSIKRLSGDGAVVTYTWQTRGGVSAYWTTDGAGAHDRLVRSGANWVWIDGDSQVEETYEQSPSTGAWRLSRRQDIDDNTLTFTYQTNSDLLHRVTTANGEWLEYSWTGNTITKITTGLSNKTLSTTYYDYTNGRLSQVRVDLTPDDNLSPTLAQSYWTQYAYDGAGRVTQVLQKDGSQVNIAYDTAGRVLSVTQQVASGNTRVTTLAYSSGFTRVTGPDGQVTQLNYDASGQLTRITAPPAFAGATAQVMQFAYDLEGNLASVTDAGGRVTSYTHDAFGNVTRVTDPNLNTIERWYDLGNRVVRERTFGSHAGGADIEQWRRFAYDGEGHLRYAIDPEGRVTEYRYTGSGTLQFTIEYPEHVYPVGSAEVSEATMNAWRNALADRSSTKITLFNYDPRGNQTEVLNYGYATATGGASTAEGFSRVYTSFDHAGRLLQRNAQGEAIESFIYDGLGRLTLSTDVHGGTTTFVFNDAGSTTTVTTAAGATSVQTFNRAGELVSSVGSGSFDVTGTSQFGYDRNGRLRITTDETGYRSFLVYDRAGQLVGQVNHLGDLTEYRRDQAGRVIAEVRYAGRVTAANLTTLQNPDNTLQMSNLRPAANAADIWSWTVYDAAGRVVQTIDGNGGVAAFAYDRSGRLVSTTSFFTPVAVAALRTAPPLTPVAVTPHAGDTVTRSFYNRAGQLVGVLDGEGYLSEIVYDHAGQKVEEVAYVTRTSSSLWAAGSFAQLRSSANPAHADNRRVRYVYDGQGQLRYQVSGAGQVTSFSYNSAGKLTATRLQALTIAPADFTYDAVKAAVVNNANDRVSSVTYDAAGRVATSTDPAGLVTSFVYDTSGRVIRSVAGSGATARITRSYYTASGLLRFSVDAEGFVRRFDYDAADRKIREVIWDLPISVTDATTITQVNSLATGGWTDARWEYDTAGRVASTFDGLGVRTLYEYNATGTLANAYAAHGTPDQSRSHYLYDAAGRVTHEYAAFGDAEQVLVQHAYDGLGNRIRTTDARGTVTTFAYDETGRIVSMVEASGTPLARTTSYEYNAFGDVVRTIDPRGAVTYNNYDNLGRVIRSVNAEGYVTETSYTVFGEVADVKQYYAPQNLLFNPDFISTNGWVVGWKSTPSISNSPLTTGPFYGMGSIKLHYSATAANQIISIATDFANNVSVNPGDVLAIDTGVEAQGVTSRLDLKVHFFNSSGVHIGVVDIDTLHGNQGFNTNMSGIVEVPAGAVGMRLELYGVSGSAGAGSFNLVEPRIVKLEGAFAHSAPVATTSFQYNKRGQVTRTTDALGLHTDNVYNLFGEQTSSTRGGATTAFQYDRLGRLVRVTDALNNFEAFTYDARGNRITARNKLGGVTTYAYDRRGQLVSETLPIGSFNSAGTLVAASVTNTYAYDARGNRTRMTEAAGLAEARTTTFAYDKLDRMVSRTGQTFLGQTPVTTYAYDAGGNLTRVTDPAGARTVYFYDQLGQVTATISPVGTYTANTYDAGGNVTSVRVFNTPVTVPANGGSQAQAPAVPGGGQRETVFTYDALGRMTRSAVVAGTQTGSWNGSAWIASTAAIETFYQYDAIGNVVRVIDPNGNATHSYYDLIGRKTAQVDGDGYLTVWDYNTNGNVTYENRYANKVGSAGALILGTGLTVSQLIGSVSASSATIRQTEYTYDLNGNRLSERRYNVEVHNGSGGTSLTTATVNYLYNGLGQVIRKTEASGDQVHYTYDVGGRLTVEARQAFVDQTGATVTPTIDYFYNGVGDLTRTRQRGNANAAERVTTYGYDGDKLRWVTNAEANGGNAVGGLTTYYWYDIAGRQTAEYYTRYNSAGSETATYEGVHTAYDAAGRVTQNWQAAYVNNVWVDRGPRAVTAYNAHGEVVNVAVGGVTQQQNRYDDAGRVFASTVGDGVWKFFGYDRNGNQTIAIASAGAAFNASTSFSAAFGQIGQANVNATYTVYDKRNMATTVIEEGRQLSVGGAGQTFTTTRGYNAFGEVSHEINVLGARVDYTYNSMGRLIRSESPLVEITLENGSVVNVRPTEHYYYDASGRLVASRDANGNLTRMTVLAGSGHDGGEVLVTSTIAADGGVRQYRYDIHGDLREIVNELGFRTAQTFDRMGRVTVVQEVRNAANTVDDLINYYAYDGLGQQVRHWNNVFQTPVLGDPVWVETYPDYNDPNWYLYTPEPTGGWYYPVIGYTPDVQSTDYDIEGRVIATRTFGGADADITTVSYAWDPNMATNGVGTFGGWIETTRMANGRMAVQSTDLFGRVTFSRDLGGRETTYTYDEAGRLASSAKGGLVTGYTWLNSGLVGQMWTGSLNSGQVNANWSRDIATYSYDRVGNRLSEQLTREKGVYTPGGWNQQTNPHWPGSWEWEMWEWENSGSWQEESYYVSNELLKNQSATYDALGRLRTWAEAGTSVSPAAAITHHYDANGNVRRTQASWRTISPGGVASATPSTSDHWFRYDSMNRVVTNRGTLVNGVITRGATVEGISNGGQDITYNAAGQRTSVTVTNSTPNGYTGFVTQDSRELYTYDEAGRLIQTRELIGTGATGPGTLRSDYTYDLLGRQTRQQDWNGSATQVVFSRTANYNDKSQVIFDRVVTRKADNKLFTSETTYNFGFGATYALGSVVSQTGSSRVDNGSWTHSRTTNSFDWYDGAVQSVISYDSNTLSNSNPVYFTTFSYDGMGRLEKVLIEDGKRREVTFTNDELGQIIRRSETRPWQAPSQQIGSPTEVWYRFGGRQMGYTGNNGTSDLSMSASITDRRQVTPANEGTFRNRQTGAPAHADFSQGIDPINSFFQGSAGGTYTVQAGDTLEGIAANLWGDASLWYTIAQANGLGSGTGLIEGQRLILPTGVVRNTHNAGTTRPYDPAEAIGDVSPTLAPTPPRRGRCGLLGMIFLAVIAVAVTVATKGAAGKFAAKAFKLGAAGAKIVGGAIAGAAGSIASQAVGVATGIQDKFSFKGVAMAAIGGAVGGALGEGGAFGEKGLFGGGWLAEAARGAVTNAAVQGIGVATGLQSKFSFASVAAAGIGAAAKSLIGGVLKDQGVSKDSFGYELATSAAKSIAKAATKSAIEGSSFGKNLVAEIPNVIGDAVGGALGKELGKELDHLLFGPGGGGGPVAAKAGPPIAVVDLGNGQLSVTIPDGPTFTGTQQEISAALARTIQSRETRPTVTISGGESAAPPTIGSVSHNNAVLHYDENGTGILAWNVLELATTHSLDAYGALGAWAAKFGLSDTINQLDNDLNKSLDGSRDYFVAMLSVAGFGVSEHRNSLWAMASGLYREPITVSASSSWGSASNQSFVYDSPIMRSILSTPNPAFQPNQYIYQGRCYTQKTYPGPVITNPSPVRARRQVADYSLQLGVNAGGAIIVPGVGGSVLFSGLINVPDIEKGGDFGLIFTGQGAGGLGGGLYGGIGAGLQGNFSRSTPQTLFTLSSTRYAELDVGVGPVSGAASLNLDDKLNLDAASLAKGIGEIKAGRVRLGPGGGLGAFVGRQGNLTITITPNTIINAITTGTVLNVQGTDYAIPGMRR